MGEAETADASLVEHLEGFVGELEKAVASSEQLLCGLDVYSSWNEIEWRRVAFELRSRTSGEAFMVRVGCDDDGMVTIGVDGARVESLAGGDYSALTASGRDLDPWRDYSLVLAVGESFETSPAVAALVLLDRVELTESASAATAADDPIAQMSAWLRQAWTGRVLGADPGDLEGLWAQEAAESVLAAVDRGREASAAAAQGRGGHGQRKEQSVMQVANCSVSIELELDVRGGRAFMPHEGQVGGCIIAELRRAAREAAAEAGLDPSGWVDRAVYGMSRTDGVARLIADGLEDSVAVEGPDESAGLEL